MMFSKTIECSRRSEWNEWAVVIPRDSAVPVETFPLQAITASQSGASYVSLYIHTVSFSEDEK